MKKLSIILTLVLALDASCATGSALENGLKTAGKAALDCAESELAAKASEIEPALEAILKTPSKTWEKQADMYGAAFTTDVEICAARTAAQKITSPVQSEAVAQDPAELSKTVTARLRTLEIKAKTN